MYSSAGYVVYSKKGGEKTDYLSLQGKPVAELKLSGSTTTTTYLHSDLLGSPRKATNDGGAVLWDEHYDPYGVKLNGVSDKIGYTGHVHDAETGYTYMQARFYDAQVGRFLSKDPIHFVDDNPFTFNRYSYVNNNPYRYTDPSGMQKKSAREELQEEAEEAQDGDEESPEEKIDDALDKLGTDPNVQEFQNLRRQQTETVRRTQEAITVVAEVAGAIAPTPVTKLSALGKLGKLLKRGGKKGDEAVEGTVELTATQLENVERFMQKLPANAKDSVSFKALPNDGVAAQAMSPGRVPGSSAMYEKQIDAAGKTIQYTKTTYDPAGNIVHVKDKITGGVYP